MSYPSRTKLLDTATVATLEDNLNEVDIPQAYRNALFMQLLLRQAKEPGLELQGQNLKLPGVNVKRKTMGGTRAESFVNFETGSNAQFFRGMSVLGTDIQDGPTVSWTDYAYLTDYFAISGTEKIENSGAMKRLDILKSRQNQTIRGMVRAGETALHSANTDTTAGTQDSWAGIRHKLATSATGTLQGLDRSVFTTFMNQVTTSVGSFASGGLDAFRDIILDCAGTNAMEMPHLIVTTQVVADAFIKALEGIHRITGSLNGNDLSASKLPTFMGVPIVWTNDVTAGYAYILNFDYIENILHQDAIWAEVRPGEPNDQWVKDQKRYVLGAAPLMLTRPEKQGLLTGLTA